MRRGTNKRVVQDKKITLVHDFIVDHKYEVVVRAIGPDGTEQAMENAVRNTIVIAGKLTVPDTPSTLTATGFIESVNLSWTNPLNFDFDHMEIWRGTLDDRDMASKVAEVKGILHTDVIGVANVTRYYWIRAVNTSGKTSDYYPRTTAGVSATTLGVAATSIDDFAITATKMFNKTIILTADSWTNNDPRAGSVAWNTHSIVYNGASYPITAGNTANAYIYWTIGAATYTTSATHPTLGTTAFMVAINTAGIHTLVWNSSANMVIGTAFIADLAVTNAKITTLSADKLTAGTIDASVITVTNLVADNITTGTLVVARTEAKNTNPLADQTSINTAADISGQGALATRDDVGTGQIDNTVISGGKIIIGLLTATNIQTGTLTGRTVQTASSGQRIILDQSDNTFQMFRGAEGAPCVLLDDDVGIGGPLLKLSSITDGFGMIRVGDGSTQYIDIRHDRTEIYATSNAAPGLQIKDNSGIVVYLFSGVDNGNNQTSYVTPAGLFGAATGYAVGVNIVIRAQEAAVADAVDAASVILRLNELLARVRTHGLIDT